MKKDISFLLEKPIAHRGACVNGALENTTESFSKAVELKLPIELDVRATKDNKIAVFHDGLLWRMTKKHGLVKNCDMSYLKSLSLKGTQSKIPELREVLDLVGGRVGLLIELKVGRDYKVLCDNLLDELSNYAGKVAFISFSKKALGYLSTRCEYALGLSALNYAKLGLFSKKRFTDDFMPDFLCYYLGHIPSKDTKRFGGPVIAWTAKNQKQYNRAKSICDNALVEVEGMDTQFISKL